MNYIYLLLFVLSCASCRSLKYDADIGFISAAQANNPEFPVQINGAYCKDSEGKPGFCAKRINSKEDLEIKIGPRPYNYNIKIQCSSPLGLVVNKDILKNESFSHVIENADLSEFLNLTCIGELFPKDRPQPISSFFRVALVVFDAKYVPRPEPYYTRGRIVFGSGALYTNLNGYKYKKGTVIKAPKDSSGFSESELMRFNYYNLK